MKKLPDHPIPIPASFEEHTYEKALTLGDKRVGYVWFKGKKIPLEPGQRHLSIKYASLPALKKVR